MGVDEITEFHIKQALSSSKILELMDKYPNLKTITCTTSIYNRIPKKYIEALNSLDIDVKIDYKWGSKPKNEDIKLKVTNLIHEGFKAKEIAEKLDISLNKVYYLARTSNDNLKFDDYKRKYGEDKRNTIINMKKEGNSAKTISEKLNIPLRTVYYILNRK